MKRTPRQILSRSVFFLMIGSAGLIVIDQFTSWSMTEKLVWPIIWIIAAIGNPIFSAFNNAKPDATKKETPSTAFTWPTTSTASSTAKKEPGKFLENILPIVIPVFVIAVLILGIPTLIKFFHNNTQEAIRNSRSVVVTNPFGIASGCADQVDLTKHLWLNPGKDYDVIELKNGQRWKWYFDRDIEYRIKATGQEAFTALTRNGYSGGTLTADRAGTLQVRTQHTHNHIEVHRLVLCTIK